MNLSDKKECVAAKLRRRLFEAQPSMQRRYVRGLVFDIVVEKEKVVVTEPHDALASAISAGDFNEKVRSSVREWRTALDISGHWEINRLADM